jgi:DNA-binding protein H-NS
MSEYLAIMSELKVLEKKAELAKRKELSTVIRKIKRSIKLYHLTAADLGLSVKNSDGVSVKRNQAKPPVKGSVNRRAKAAKAAKIVPAKYADQSGNSWSGRGRTPRWLATQLAEGKSLGDFLIGSPAQI